MMGAPETVVEERLLDAPISDTSTARRRRESGVQRGLVFLGRWIWLYHLQRIVDASLLTSKPIQVSAGEQDML